MILAALVVVLLLLLLVVVVGESRMEVVAVQAGSGGVFKADGRCQGAPTGH